MAHPHNSEWFRVNRSSIYTFVDEKLRGVVIDGTGRNVLVKAPVKSGKREHVECIAVRFPDAAVFYVTSLDRKDVARQKAELALYGVDTHLINSEQKALTAILAINRELAAERRVILCFDECDYGSGSEQKMASMYHEFVDDERVIKLYYSASAHETEASKLRDRDDYAALTYVPPPEYCGAEYFLDEGLVAEDVDSFFEKDEDENICITEHAKLVVRESIKPDRHIGVVRVGRGFSTRNFKNRLLKADIQAQLQTAMGDGREWRIVPVDEKNSHDWEDADTARRYTNDREVNYLFIIVQTCTRGTDLKGWHHRLAFWHDARSKRKSNLNTLLQAFLRPCHYSSSYGGVPQPIRLYVDYVVVEMAAYDNLPAYLAAGGKPPARTTRARGGPDYLLSEETFNSVAAAREWASLRGRVSELVLGEDRRFAYRNGRREIKSEAETRADTDLGWGVATSARIMPVVKTNGETGYIVIYKNRDADTASTASSQSIPLDATRHSMYEA